MAEKFNNVGLWDITFYRLDDEGNPYKKNGKVVVYEADTDFADTEIYKVIDYCTKKYWEDKVVRVCTFWTFAARAAVKDVWRVYWIPFAEMNNLAKTIPEKAWTKLKWALDNSVEFAEAYPILLS